MEAPDKIYIQMSSAIPGIGFVGPAWDNSRNNKGLSEYINKDALLKWITAEKEKLDKIEDKDDVQMGALFCTEAVIDKLNSM